MATKKQQTPPANNNNAAYDPLSEEVVSKVNTAPIGVDPQLLAQPIPETVFTPASVADEINPLDEADNATSNNSGKGSAASNSFVPPNPELNDIPPKQKEMAAAQMVEYLMTGYQKLHQGANKMLQIGKKRVTRLQMEGKIDLQAAVPYEDGKFLPLSEFIKEYNEDMKDFLTIDPEWKAQVVPPLVRIFQKRGIGMSDEMFVGLLFAQDISVKAKMYFDMRGQTASILQFAVEQTERMNNVIPMPTRPAPAPTQGPSEPGKVVEMERPPITQTNQTDQGQASTSYTKSPAQDAVMNELTGNQLQPSQVSGMVENQQLPQYGGESTVGAIDRFVKNRTVKKSPPKKKAGKKKRA